MNNTEHFGKLTERMQAFREEVLDAKPYIDAQRAVLATEAYKENQNQPRVMVRALMLQKILEGMSILVLCCLISCNQGFIFNINTHIFQYLL